MSQNILKSIAEGEAFLASLRTIVTNEPEFKFWDFCGGDHAAGSLIQLFPRGPDGEMCEGGTEGTQASALRIARAFGGRWSRDRHDGSWKGELEPVAPYRVSRGVILHRVDFVKKTGDAIELARIFPS